MWTHFSKGVIRQLTSMDGWLQNLAGVIGRIWWSIGPWVNTSSTRMGEVGGWGGGERFKNEAGAGGKLLISDLLLQSMGATEHRSLAYAATCEAAAASGIHEDSPTEVGWGTEVWFLLVQQTFRGRREPKGQTVWRNLCKGVDGSRVWRTRRVWLGDGC